MAIERDLGQSRRMASVDQSDARIQSGGPTAHSELNSPVATAHDGSPPMHLLREITHRVPTGPQWPGPPAGQ
jgi:hypothetical protein